MTAISVNGVAIGAEAIAAEAQHHSAETAEAAWEAAIRALVVRELLLQEVRRLDLAPEPLDLGEGRRETDEDSLIRQLIENEVHIPEADTETCQRYFNNNRDRFRCPDIVEASHILFAASPADEARYREAFDRAEGLIVVLQDNPALFEELAKLHSACLSASSGGHLGQLTRGQTAPELDTFLFSLEEDQLCPIPVRSQFGAHVLRIDRRIEGTVPPFESIRHKVGEYLREASWHRAVAQYVAILSRRADIRGTTLSNGDGPLVQ